MALLESRLEEFDLVSTSYLFANQYRDVDAFAEASTHFLLQVRGYGNPDQPDERLERVLEAADTVTVLDPGVAQFYSHLMDLEEVSVVPNPPNLELFDAQDPDASEGFVLTPKTGSLHKSGAILAQTAAQTPAVTYEAHIKRPQDFLQATNGQKPGNIHLKPPVPFTAMPRRYRDSLLVFNAAERETLPNVCYEALMSQRPYVAYRDAAATLQTIPDLDTDDFGLTAQAFLEKYLDQMYAGDHLYLVSDQTTLPQAISQLLDDRDEREAVARRGREWVESTFQDYGWKEKAETLVEVALDGE